MRKTENLKVPTCHTLLKPDTIMGISREAFILNVALGMCFVIIFGSVVMLLFSVLLHFIIYFFTRKDPLILTIFYKKYLKEKEYYHEG